MWPESVCVNGDDYAYKSSPESFSDSSFCNEMDAISNEDFITQLSSDLGIPLLLNSGEDEMGVLNSLLDQSADEILSDVTPSPEYVMEDKMDVKDFDFLNEMLQFPSDNKNCSKTIQNEAKKNDKDITYFDYLNGALEPDIKSEEHSDESCSSRNSLEPSTPPPIIGNKHFFPNNLVPKEEKPVKVEAKLPQVQRVKVPIKRIPIQPKSPYTCNSIILKNIKTEANDKIIITPTNVPQKIVVLDTKAFKPITPCIAPAIKPINISSISLNSNMDPRILKRQERRIKNRESASISRKKKKDYLTSLEEQVKNLTLDNQRLLQENKSLKERLSCLEEKSKFFFNPVSVKRAKPAIVLCAFLLVVGFNFNFPRSPHLLSTKRAGGSEESSHPKLPDYHGRNLLWTSEETQDKPDQKTYFSPLTMCPASINQTESARLLLELERWIGKPKPQDEPIPTPPPIRRRMKSKRKKMRIDSSLTVKYGPENQVQNEIQVFSPKAEQLYSEFFDAINRQDDTFYVVSFSEQHMLLPALYHNKTRRPKMSLLMPSAYPSDTSNQTFVPLMQIDCEVLDTKLIKVKYGSIPRPYRQYNNDTKPAEPKSDTDNVTSPKKYSDGRKVYYKPYVLTKSTVRDVDYD